MKKSEPEKKETKKVKKTTKKSNSLKTTSNKKTKKVEKEDIVESFLSEDIELEIEKILAGTSFAKPRKKETDVNKTSPLRETPTDDTLTSYKSSSYKSSYFDNKKTDDHGPHTIKDSISYESNKSNESVKIEPIKKKKKHLKLNIKIKNPFKFNIYFKLKDYLKHSYKQLLIIIGSIAACVLLVVVISKITINKSTEVNSSPIIKEEEKADKKYLDIYNKYHDLAYYPDDYVGQIIFESGIINEPILQGEDNSTYLRRDYQTFEYRVDGPIYIDMYCKVDFDNNIVLYGHNMPKSMDRKQEKLFTPLHKLEDENNYYLNKYILLVLKDHIEEYEIAYVYNVEVEDDGYGHQYLLDDEPNYYYPNYTKEEFEEYKQKVEGRALYDTNVDVRVEDKLLTLQTCYEDSTSKLIVVAKRIKSLKYE